ncbi:hypothetical protein HYALB_00005983, partial [Hymenoscyphus albidus]
MSTTPPPPPSLPNPPQTPNPKLNPTITLLPILPQDLPSLAHLESLVFKHDPFSITAFGPLKDSAENLALRVRGLERSCRVNKGEGGRWARGWKAVVGEGEEVVGWCEWSFDGEGDGDGEGKGDGEGDGEEEEEEIGWGISADIKFCEDVFGKADEWMRECTHENPYAKLHTLIIHPAYQRLGIGTRLLQQGLEEVDRLHLQCVLGASPEGKGLYERFGFSEVRRMEIKLEEYVNGRGLGMVGH